MLLACLAAIGEKTLTRACTHVYTDMEGTICACVQACMLWNQWGDVSINAINRVSSCNLATRRLPAKIACKDIGCGGNLEYFSDGIACWILFPITMTALSAYPQSCKSCLSSLCWFSRSPPLSMITNTLESCLLFLCCRACSHKSWSCPFLPLYWSSRNPLPGVVTQVLESCLLGLCCFTLSHCCA